MDGNSKVKDQEKIKEEAFQHFKRLPSAKEEPSNYERFLRHIPKLITESENTTLTKSVDEEKLIWAIWSLHPDKSPGPDGFCISFFQYIWDLIKKYLLKMIHWVQTKIKVGGNTNSTYLALTPKESRPTFFDCFRPISLWNSSYKIINKLMANRLKLFPQLISEN